MVDKRYIIWCAFQSETDCLLDIISNVAEHIEIIKQILSVYQALIVYIINSWRSCDQDKECNEKFHKLFSKYNHILDAVMVTFIFLIRKKSISFNIFSKNIYLFFFFLDFGQN